MQKDGKEMTPQEDLELLDALQDLCFGLRMSRAVTATLETDIAINRFLVVLSCLALQIRQREEAERAH